MMASTVRSIVCLHMGACSVRLHGSPDGQGWLSTLPETTSWQRDCEIMRILHPGARSFLVVFSAAPLTPNRGRKRAGVLHVGRALLPAPWLSPLVELELPLQRAVGQAPPALEQGDRLIENLLKGHHPPSRGVKACRRRCGNWHGRLGVCIPHLAARRKGCVWRKRNRPLPPAPTPRTVPVRLSRQVGSPESAGCRGVQG